MVEATGNVGQVTDEETKKAAKSRKAPKTKPKKVKVAAPEAEAAPGPEPTTNGASKIDELEPVTEVASSTTEEPLTGMQKIYKDREDLTEKMLSGKVEEGKILKLDTSPRFIDAPIFPDAYCPLCGMKLSGNSKTGFKQAFYTHPFTPAIALGKPCELKGKKLRAPTARMEIVD